MTLPEGWLSPEEAHELRRLSRGRTVLELGAWKGRSTAYTSGAIWKYAQQVGPARDGAVTHPGGAAEVVCYADV